MENCRTLFMSADTSNPPPFDMPVEWTERVDSCPVCTGREREMVAEGMRDVNYGAIAGDWRFWRCLSCRSIYMDPRIDSEHIAKAYANYETHHADTGRRLRRGLAGFVQRAGDAYVQRRYGLPGGSDSASMAVCAYLFLPLLLERDYMMRHASKPKRSGSVLDVGCGNGDFLARMRDAGWSVRGIDFDPQAVAIAQSRGLDVVLATVDSVVLDQRRYDLVAASHVIEHLHHPESFLAELFEKVAPGGALWIATPNSDSPVRRLAGPYWDKWEVPRHLQLFNVDSLRAFIRRTLGDQYRPVFRRRGWHIYWSMAQSAVLREGKRRGERPALPARQKPLALMLECAAILLPSWGDEIVVEVRKPQEGT
jgi:2-polyprenyl-3-methyl-5-hydroxy-6-metoxy-1,4-benzoquinol methylase